MPDVRLAQRRGRAVFLPTAALAALTESAPVQWTGEFAVALGWLVLVLVLSGGAVSLLNWLTSSGNAVDVASLLYLVPASTALFA